MNAFFILQENLIEELFDFIFDTDTSWESDAKSIIIHPQYSEKGLLSSFFH